MENLPKILRTQSHPPEDETKEKRNTLGMSPKLAVEVLAGNRKELKAMESYIGPDLLKKMSSPNFKDKYPQDFEKAVQMAEDEYEKYLELAKEIGPKIMEQFKRNLLAYLEKLGIELEEDDWQNRINSGKFLFMDVFGYYGVLAESQSLKPENGGVYIPSGNVIVLNMKELESWARVYSRSLKNKPESGYSEEIFREAINSTFSHELLHVASYHDFWIFGNGEIEVSIPRRIGVRSLRAKVGGNRLKSLNEAITEKINLDIHSNLSDIKDPDIKDRISHLINNVSYKDDRSILDTLCYLVDWEYLVSAYFNKKDFMDLDRELKKQTGLTLTDIDASMKMDEETDYQYSYTEALLKSKMSVFTKIKYRFKKDRG